MNLYGNSIWNNATPNSEKSVMVTPKENLNSVTKALDEAGVNYCYFIKDNSVAIAIARIAVNQSELENLRKITEIRSLATENPRTNYSPKSSVIGNIPYREIRNRHYQKLETDLALKVADELNKNGISFSGRIYDKTTTLTVDTADRQELERIIGDVVEVRNSYKRKIENIDIVNDTFSALAAEHKTILQPLADMCYTKSEAFSETLCSELDNIKDLTPEQTRRFATAFSEVYGSLNESEFLFADRKKISDLYKLFNSENQLAKLTQGRNYSAEQISLIFQMVELRSNAAVIESVLDEAMTLEDMERFLSALKDNSYDNTVKLIAEIKHRSRQEIKERLGNGYIPTLSSVDVFLQDSKNIGTVVRQAVPYSDLAGLAKKFENGTDEAAIAKDYFDKPKSYTVSEGEKVIGTVSISVDDDGLAFSGTEHSVRLPWNVIAGYLKILTEENLDYGKYEIGLYSVFGKGSFYTIPITTTDSLLNRLEKHGLVPTDEMRGVLFQTDNNNWNRLVIPDRFGNKYNNIDISEVLTPEEMSVVRTVTNVVIETENKKRAEQAEQEQFFKDCDISDLLAQNTLDLEEIESLGYIFFDDSHIDKYNPSERIIFGHGLRETDVFNLSKRIRQGEDISEELVVGLLGAYKTKVKIPIDERNTVHIEFTVEQINNGLSLSYGSIKRELTYQQLANSYLTLFENGYKNAIMGKDLDVSESAVVENFRSRTMESFHLIGGRTEFDIELEVEEKLKTAMEEYGIAGELNGVVLYGSRSRGLETSEDTDIDIVVQIDGADLKEHALFNIFNELNIEIDGIKVDINPIRPEETGTLETYLPKAEAYLEQKHRLDEKEQFFLDCDLAKLLAKDSLAYDELDSLAFLFFDKGRIDRHARYFFADKAKAYDLATRYQNGEDISKELAEWLFANSNSNIDKLYVPFKEYNLLEYPEAATITYTDNGYSFKYHHLTREVTFEEMGQAFLQIFKKEYEDIQKDIAEKVQLAQKQTEKTEPVFTSDIDQRTLIEEAKKRINDFVNEEYKTDDGADFSDLSNIKVAFTTTEDGRHDIQASIDLEHTSIVKKVDDSVAEIEKYETLNALVDDLYGLDFSDLTYISDEKIKEIEERTTGDDDIKITSMTVEVKDEEIRRINADDIQVGDRFEYNGVEYTVKSLQGDQPDAVKVLYNEIDFTNRNYDVISNIDKYVLAEQAAYLGRDEYLLDETTISIDKYSFKIDFDSIREISFVSRNEEYIGGLDSDGHERKDNFGVSEEETSFYLSDGYIIKYETGNGDYPLTKEQAIEDIESLIDKALATPDMSIRITDTEGKISYLERDSFTLATQQPRDDFDQNADKFFFTENGVEEIYYNPDSSEGGQFVISQISNELILEAAEECPDKAEFFPYLDSRAMQVLIDITSDEFNAYVDYFNRPSNYEGCTEQTLSALVARAKRELNKDTENNRFEHSEPDILDEINTEEIRRELENSGIVNGKVADIDKLNADSFISEVTENIEAAVQEQDRYKQSEAVSLPKAENFRITDYEIGSGTTMQRFNNNLAAIRTLKELEADGRQAAPEEQETLSRYVGWGGLSEFFKESNPHYQELKDLLTEDEYSSARATTLDSFYTSPVIIDSIYTVLQNAGFEGGNILEPSMGIGNFFGRMPQEMQEHSKLFGVEIDSLTGRIAKQLYPQAHIDIKGFEKTKFKDNSFDVAIGNIPFGDFSLQYDQQSLKIHDYFFMQALDKVKDGGIVAFVTSKGTLDKRDPSFRQQLADKANLIGAVRLPNNAFKTAGTEVTADIVFLQKRQSPLEKTPDWVNIGVNSAGLPINEYFVQHPDMVLGEIVQGNKMFGRNDDTMCVPFKNSDLSKLLSEAVSKIKANYNVEINSVVPVENSDVVIPTGFRNYSYIEYKNNIYSIIDDEAVSVKDSWKRSYSAANIERAKAYIEIRDTVRELLAVQQETFPDVEDRIKELQAKLNTQYDSFYKKYGLMHSRFNGQLFRDDSSYPLMLSLEDKVDKDKLIKKSDIFFKRTIKVPQVVESVDTPQEALALSLAEKGKVDLEYMSSLTDIPADDIVRELRGEIYPVPELSHGDNIVYQSASEYLSGDIYTKISAAKSAAESNSIFEGNISALEAAKPTPLTAADIDIECGATWIPPEIYQQFMYEIFKTPNEFRADSDFRFPWQSHKKDIIVEYSKHTNKWNVTNKSADRSVTAQKTYGTKVKNGYQIFESVLNLHIPNITKTIQNPNNPSETVKVMDIEATKLVKQKAEAIRKEFKDWIFKDPERRRMLVDMYNRQFNCIRPREYDGSHLQFHGMNASIELHQHQKNAIAHAIYGGNTLFAHCVGAGKTFEMIATAMESKRLGLCSKSLFAVPNHLTEQVGADFMKLYPSANILVATKKDFTKQNRSKLLAKIATGNYDAVIIGHSQLGMIPISPDRQERLYKEQIEDITEGIRELKAAEGGKFQIKQMERTRKSLQAKLEKLNNLRKDNTVYFEELGIDKLFVDEAHEFKNLMSVTKLQNVSGISGRTSQRATDLFMKCRYLDEKTGGKGVVFATGTPVSNSVTELHTMMRYLQYDFLAEHGMQNFDNWVSVFGKQKTDYELAPTGDKFKARTRIASYANMPELMTMFKQCADVRTSDSLNLPVPDCELHIVNAEPTPLQKDLVSELSARADDVQSGSVLPTEDNMLKITGDGRKVGLDPRLVDPELEDNPNTKLNQCVNNVFQIWQDTAEDKLTQIIFCDLGVPKSNQQAENGKETEEQSMAEIDSLEESGSFCVYDDIKSKLSEMGVPEKEIAFIHEAKTEAQKSELFEKVRSGEIRVLIGSTAKMGTGTNVQDRLVALHDLDVPWRPADLEQRRGRMVRQGNINDKVHLYRYVTKGTFDAYSYQLLETKQRFISQVITSKTPARTCTDVDQEALTYSEIKALCTGDERIKEKLTLENRVKELRLFKKEYNGTHYELEDKVSAYPQKREAICNRISRIENDFEKTKSIKFDSEHKPIIKLTVKGVGFADRKKAAEALQEACNVVYTDKGKSFEIGEIHGFKISVLYDQLNQCISATIKGEAEYSTELSQMPSVNITKLEKLVLNIGKQLNNARTLLAKSDIDIESAKEILAQPFEYAQELAEKSERLEALNDELNTEAATRLQSADKPQRTHYFGKAAILSSAKISVPKQTQEQEQNRKNTVDL